MHQETILISLSVNELHSIISKSVNDALQAHSLKAKVEEAKYLTKKEVSSMLHITVNTLNNYTRDGLINSYKMGRRVLYKSDEINNYLLKN